MAGLTVTEKAHWKDRIARRIDKRIEAIWAEEPNLKERIDREAARQAEESLGIGPIQAELAQIETQEQQLDRRRNQLCLEALAIVQGEKVDEVRKTRHYWNGALDPEVKEAVDRRKAVIEEQLLAADERGKRILALRAERENLLDTVWLATSPVQIKELWKRVVALLGDQETPLQRDAMAIPPLEE